MDSDLAESISAFKSALEGMGARVSFSSASAERIAALKERFQLPRRYREFLAECDPIEVETATPAEQLQLHPVERLEEEQKGFSVDTSGKLLETPSRNGWRPSWFIVAHSSQLGDPYFLDTSKADAEGDCPVYTAMTGTDAWQPKLCASGFATFLRILAITMEVSKDFDLDDYDPDNERVFREAIGARIRQVDPAAFKAGHWT